MADSLDFYATHRLPVTFRHSFHRPSTPNDSITTQMLPNSQLNHRGDLTSKTCLFIFHHTDITELFQTIKLIKRLCKFWPAEYLKYSSYPISSCIYVC
jgi:hypothetical protein